MAPTRRGERGFTLTELLIVVVVAALLASMIIPTISRAAAAARSLKCKKNLASIGQAYTTFQVHQELTNVSEIFAANTWRTALHPYLGAQTAPYYCPEDDAPKFTLPISQLRIYGYEGSILYEVQLFDSHPYWLEGNHDDFAPDKPAMWRVNDDVYNGGTLNRAHMPAYTPGSDPTVSWWVIEDQRYGNDNQYATGDQDFNDLNIRMTDLGGGVYDIETDKKAAGYSFGIVNEDGEEKREVGGKVGPTTMEGDGGSYGVNWLVTKFQRSHIKILATDFPEEVIYAGSRLKSIPSNWNEVEARHLGEINYVMTDGSVHSARPGEIDPADPIVDEEMWTVDVR